MDACHAGDRTGHKRGGEKRLKKLDVLPDQNNPREIWMRISKSKLQKSHYSPNYETKSPPTSRKISSTQKGPAEKTEKHVTTLKPQSQKATKTEPKDWNIHPPSCSQILFPSPLTYTKKSTTQSSILNQKNLRKLFFGVTSQKPATQKTSRERTETKQNKTNNKN